MPASVAHGAVTLADYSRRVPDDTTTDWRTRLPAERDRAARQYLAGGLPDGEDTARVWQPRDVAGLRARLGRATVAAWSEQDVLHVLWRGEADEVQLAGGVQPQLWPVDGAGDLWEASLRIRGLDESVITIVAAASRVAWSRPARSPTSWSGVAHGRPRACPPPGNSPARCTSRPWRRRPSVHRAG